MDQNSSEPADTGNPRVNSLQLTLEWLDREGGQQRNARALRGLLESTLTALSRGDLPPEKDTNTLRDLLHLEEGHTRGQPLRAADLATWWAAREEQLRQMCAGRGCLLTPSLVVKTGGGRGLPSRLSFDFRPNDDVTPDGSDPDLGLPAGHIRYQLDPAKPALWLRLLVGSRPFPVASWRGYLLLGSAVLNVVLIGLIWWALYVSWAQSHPITSADLARLGLAAMITAGLWWLCRPVWQLPTQRVSLAGPTFLAMSELYGQLRTMPAPGHKLKSREFAVVRHWGTCPSCSAEVDLADGGGAFPERLVGRCHDAPLEHVYSFDPVRLVGAPLRHSA